MSQPTLKDLLTKLKSSQKDFDKEMSKLEKEQSQLLADVLHNKDNERMDEVRKKVFTQTP